MYNNEPITANKNKSTDELLNTNNDMINEKEFLSYLDDSNIGFDINAYLKP